MSYGTPAVGGYPPRFGQQPTRPQGGALPGLAVLMIIQLVLQLAILIWVLNQVGAGYLKFAFGFGDQPRFMGCGVFTQADTTQCAALIVMIIAAFMGRTWVRPAATVLLLINAYVLGSSLINELSSDHGGWSAMTGTTAGLWLTLDLIAQTVISVVVPIIVLATRNAGGPSSYQPLAAMPVPAPQPGYAPPMPPQDARGGAPGFPPPPAQPPMQPGQPPMQPPGQPGQPPYGGYPPNR
ncbi:hypothetical protein E6W39_30765 [Kitasatospora acidiphila]|uniref:Uncharacterized protein n=1 Tax=Kitasatospora acidiphila TaxID=2567942 RepID=A0A540WBM4_9ACTN|nr:hypothetical protein [Kitasatospora acidiphila]TQF05814.1 hypothetical protein E6W39_30765 [Kitasatospora acidiphila]